MKSLILVGNELVISCKALEEDVEAANFVRENKGVFEYDVIREVWIMKPWAVLVGLRAIARGSV